MLLQHLPQQRHAADFVVAQHQVEGLPLQGGDEVLPGLHPRDVAGQVLGLQPGPDALRIGRVVLEMQHADGGGHLGPSCSPRSDSTTSLNSSRLRSLSAERASCAWRMRFCTTACSPPAPSA